MISTPRREKAVAVFSAVMLALWLTILLLPGCSPKEPPLSQQALAFKQEVESILSQIQQSLAEPTVQENVPALDKVLQKFAKTTRGMCIECPYRMGVLNHKGDLLTTYPKNDMIGLNFSTYKKILEPLQKHRISQAQAFLPDGTKIYFISVPLIQNNRGRGVLILALSPTDLEKKWHLTEKEFLSIDFNRP